MKNIFKSIFSMQVMTVLLIFMALSCAVATFVENDYGPLGSKSFIYGQTWFETIMLLLTIGVIFNIIWFKMYQKSKFFIFMIHISLVFIFIGAATTRYFGYEAIITIPEGSMENRMYSTDEFIQVKIGEESYDKKVLMTPLSQTSFSYDTTLNNKSLEIKLNRFVANAVEKIVQDKDGEPLINIIVSEFMGTKSIDLKNKKEVDTKFLTFTLNTEKKESKKPIVYFETDDSFVYYTSNIETIWYTNELKKGGTIKANTKTPLKLSQIYKVGQTQFMIPEATSKGKLKTVSAKMHEIPKDKQLNAVVLDVTYDGKTQEVALFGKGGSTQGFVKKIKLDNKDITFQWGAKELKLPFSILLNDFRLDRYPGSKSPSTYESDIKIYDKENSDTLEYTIFMNNTLDYRGYRFFQSSYKQDESATILSVNKDPGKLPTYIGYFLLFIGLILSLFTKKGRFRKLSSKKYDIQNVKEEYYIKKAALALFMIFTISLFSPSSIYANELKDEQKIILNIDKEHASKFGELLIQDYQGRIKPINSLAIEIINKLTRKSSIYNLDANQFFLSMMLYPNIWQEIRFIKVKDKKLKKLIGLNENAKTLSFKDIYTTEGKYKLEEALEISNAKKPALRDNFDKDLIKVDEKLNIAYTLFTGDFVRAFPKTNDKNNKWLNANEAKNMELDESAKIVELTKAYYFSLDDASRINAPWEKVNKALEDIKTYQKSEASHIIPSQFKLEAELIFNKYNIFERLTPFYLILGFLLLMLVFVKIFKSDLNIEKITKIVLVLLTFGFIFHTFGLGLRWYVAGHAPWSNGYESMIYIAWAIVLSGIFFSKQSNLALATTAILSGITLFVAHLSWMEPQITTLAPVLKSYWLTIHVSVITASYGFLGLSCLLGFISLCLFIFANPKKENERFFNILVSIKESNRINEMSILIGLVLLVIGNFLGGIWANESWGRYWGWDPKETWTLISIIIYAVIIHLRYIKGLFSEFTLATLSVISYSSIIMTYFGVNYYLAGKHSYAAGDPVPIPDFVPVTAIIILVVILLAYRNRKVI